METRLDNMTKRSKKANCGPQLLAPCMDGAEYDADNIAPEPQAAPQQAQVASAFGAMDAVTSASVCLELFCSVQA